MGPLTGYVTFWEACTMKLYHLPNRCTLAKAKGGGSAKKHVKKEVEEQIVAKDDDSDEEENPTKNVMRWAGEAPDTSLQEEDMMLLPTVGRAMPKPKQKATNKK